MNITMQNTAQSHQGLWMRACQLTCAAIVGLLSHEATAQISTTINFDDYASGTEVTTQYQAQGVTMSGVTILDAVANGGPYHSGPNAAYAPSGLMIMNLSAADVKTVSVYSGSFVEVGMYAYDASNNLIGQMILPVGSPFNSILSVTSSSAPIARVEIHDGGASFFVDDFTFITAPPAEPICRIKDKALYDAVSALNLTSFKCSPSASKNRILKEIVEFEKLRAANAGQKKLLAMLAIIKLDISASIKSADAAPLLLKVNELINLVKANSCAL